MKLKTDLVEKLHTLIPGDEINDPKITKNQRLVITKLGMEGLDDMYDYSKKSVFYRNLNIESHKTKKDTENYLNELIRRTKDGYAGWKAMYWFIRLRSSQKVIGTFGFMNLDENKKSIQIGKGLSPDYWGKGYVYELLGIMLTYAFITLDLNYIYSMTQRTNIANIKSMEKSGFKVVKLIDDYVDGIGIKNDTVKMIVRKEEASPIVCFDIAFKKYKTL
ncbi:MAG: GNAT family N-acetyltransferase [Candidatus Marinimicrobia bacterium]|nr:GNAT family N-acetyltransferase [Candidatus Neomarinimicrobiota bacterium]